MPTYSSDYWRLSALLKRLQTYNPRVMLSPFFPYLRGHTNHTMPSLRVLLYLSLYSWHKCQAQISSNWLRMVYIDAGYTWFDFDTLYAEEFSFTLLFLPRDFGFSNSSRGGFEVAFFWNLHQDSREWNPISSIFGQVKATASPENTARTHTHTYVCIFYWICRRLLLIQLNI